MNSGIILLTRSDNQFQNYGSNFFQVYWPIRKSFASCCWLFSSKIIWMLNQFVTILDSYFWNWLMDSVSKVIVCIFKSFLRIFVLSETTYQQKYSLHWWCGDAWWSCQACFSYIAVMYWVEGGWALRSPNDQRQIESTSHLR